MTHTHHHTTLGMTSDDALFELNAAHEAAGFVRIATEEDMVYEWRGNRVCIPRSVVSAFVAFREANAQQTAILLGETLLSNSARESALTFVGDDFAFEYDLPEQVIFGPPNGDEPVAVVGRASDSFVAAHLLQPDFVKRAAQRTRVLRSPRIASPAPAGDVEIRYMRPLTIRVDRLPAAAPTEQAEKTDVVVSACLYTIATTHQVPMRLQDGWSLHPQDEPARRFIYEEKSEETNFSFPRARYNPDLLRFYTLGMSSDVPELQYLAFYQVLEYFFVTLADEQLYARLARRFHEPTFRATPAFLDRVIQDVNDHRRATDETEMLKMVIARFVEHNALIEAIDRIHTGIGERLYWNKVPRFGTPLQVNKEPNHTFGDVARIIKAVRNALVHSSDRHEREQRHVPFSDSSVLVRKEVPLLRFLAEKAIVGSATVL